MVDRDQGKSFIVPFTRTARALKSRESSLMTSHWRSWRRSFAFALCCLIAPLTLSELALSSPKIKSESSIISWSLTRKVWRRSRSRAHCEAANPWQERDAVFFLLFRSTSTLGDLWRRWNCRLNSLLQTTREDGGQSSRQSRTTGENSTPDGQHETVSCENHSTKGDGPQDGVATPSPDISSCDLYGFRSLKNFCCGRHFKNHKDVEFTLRT